MSNTPSPFLMEDVHWRDHHSVPDWAVASTPVTAAASVPVVSMADTSKVVFNTSKMEDPHIQTILKYVAADLGKTVQQLESQIRADMDKFASTVMHKAPLLYGTMFENFIEDEAIHLFTKTKIGLVQTAAKFTPSMFSQLRRKVKMEHSPGMFPLKNKIDRLPLANEEYVLVPSSRPEDQSLNSVKTAAATEKGTFAFNVHYCQKIMEFAHVKGVMPKGKKYKNNGGTFPPEWCYVEFLLLHEWMHYKQADWHYMKLFKETGQITNWVGDFRSNYELVKGGLPAIPGLLYNRHINYDTQGTMREMYDVVRAEFDKLTPPEKDEIKKQLEKHSDDHDQQKQPPEPGEKPDNNEHPGGGKDQDPGDQSKPPEKQQDMGEGQKKDKGGDKPQPGGNDKSNKPSGKPGEGKGEGNGGSGGEASKDKHPEKPEDGAGSGSEPSEKEMEESAKETRSALNKGMDKGEQSNIDPQGESDEQRRVREEAERLKRAGQQIKHAVVDYSKERPTYDWEQLIKQFAKNAEGKVEESYAKLNKRDLPQMVDQLDREGTARVKPAEVDTEGRLKLTVVVDTSGSMQSILGKVYANLGALLSKRSGASVTDKFNVLRFSDHYELFSGSIKAGKAQELDVERLTPIAGKAQVTMDWLFSTAESGATDFTPGVVATVERLIKAKNAVLIITDSDCLYEPNFGHLSALIKKHMDSVYVILSSRWEYEQARSLLKIKPNNLSYFK